MRRWSESRSSGPEPDARVTAGSRPDVSGRVSVPASGTGPGTVSSSSRTGGPRGELVGQPRCVVGADEQVGPALLVQGEVHGRLVAAHRHEGAPTGPPPGPHLADAG